VQVAMLANQASNYLVSGKTPKRMGNAHVNIVPYQVFPTADGRVVVAVGNDGQFARFCELAGHAAVAREPGYADNAGRVERRAELVQVIAGWMLQRSTAQWIALLEPAGVPCAPILELPEVFRHPQVVHRGMRLDADGLPMVATPIRFDGERPVSARRPPALDEQGDAIREHIGRSGGWPAD
jgi:crotonobetainyl-CoA:carnitine CoA-transferase CaiB-like acyl-CoA transferase